MESVTVFTVICLIVTVFTVTFLSRESLRGDFTLAKRWHTDTASNRDNAAKQAEEPTTRGSSGLARDVCAQSFEAGEVEGNE